jgi:4-amino-4-deoxy-L-arabinose transferase-like glycosyltransferase
MFVYNGSARVHPTGSSVAHGSAAGPLRLFDTRPFRYGGFIGVELLAALVLAPLALLLARRPGGTRLQRAFIAFLAAWLVPALVLFSAVGQLHPRYLEALTPAVAAALGIALAALAGAAARRRTAALGLALGAVVVAAYALQLGTQGAPEHVLSILSGGFALLVLALAAGRGERARTAVAVAGVLALVCVLAGPAARSTAVVRRGESDSGHPGQVPAAELQRLSSYLGSHTRGDRYEVASAYYAMAGPLIARDGRPVMVLTSVLRRPVVSVGRLADAVRRGDVHYFLVSGSCGRRPPGHAILHCPATVRWARAHAVDVSARAGLPARGLLFRFTSHP